MGYVNQYDFIKLINKGEIESPEVYNIKKAP